MSHSGGENTIAWLWGILGSYLPLYSVAIEKPLKSLPQRRSFMMTDRESYQLKQKVTQFTAYGELGREKGVRGHAFPSNPWHGV